jgi:hypothetical protein
MAVSTIALLPSWLGAFLWHFRDLKIDLNGDLNFNLKLSSAPDPI